ncbi:MAG: TSUP family transporter [Ilumatobacter sp.]|uniref:TSUP family transporter n=1 Tax=Ilumatobacter sp. TaxID=1967498 RepID=UPI003919C3CA
MDETDNVTPAPADDRRAAAERAGDGFDVDAIVSAASTARGRDERRRARAALGVSASVTVVWLIYVTAWSQWDRVIDNWVSSITMVAGSFVAGATPQGGGAVAFPVFTKGLEIPSEVARTFSLCIQTIGMGAASCAILIRRRRVEVGALVAALPAALGGFLVGYLLLSDRDLLFAPSVLPGAYVKVGFTLLTAGMAAVIYLAYRVHVLEVRNRVVATGQRATLMLVVCGAIGGLVSSQVGSGADVLLYLGLVVLAGVSPRVGVPTSVLLMASVSILGFVLIGIVDGQLDITLVADGVTAVGGTAIDGPPLEASRFDLFGLWIAAAPIVAWGAPLGSWATSRLSDRRLVVAVVALAMLEVVTTVIFLDELRSEVGLVVFAVGGAIAIVGGLLLLQRHRVRLLGLAPLDPEASLRRSMVDLGPDHEAQVGERSQKEEPR